LLLTAGENDQYARGLLAQRGASTVQALLRKWTPTPNTLDVDAATTALWEYLTGEAKLLTKVTLRSQKETPLGTDVWQVNGDKVYVVRGEVLDHCSTCKRVYTIGYP